MRVICVAGGPGFSPAYLLHASARALDTYVTAFEASGDFTSNVHALVRHLVDADAAGQIAIVAHSWGCLLTAAALQNAPRLQNTTRIVLINPVPVTRAEFDIMSSGFRKCIPLRSKLALILHALRRNERGAMRELLPHYAITPDDQILSEMALNVADYRKGMQRIRWPEAAAVAATAWPCTVVRGEYDITDESLLAPLLCSARAVLTIEGSGHFPMYDNPDGFSRTLREALV